MVREPCFGLEERRAPKELNGKKEGSKGGKDRQRLFRWKGEKEHNLK